MIDAPIHYQKLEPMQIAFIKTCVDNREAIPPLFERLRAACGDAIGGGTTAANPPMVIFHGGAVKEGFLIEAAYPVRRPVETGEVHTRSLEAASALTALHYGPHQTIRESVLKMYSFLERHAWMGSLLRREVYQVLNLSHPEKNVTEVQIILHEWERLFAEGAQNAFGAEDRQWLTQGIESITPDSSFEEYTSWVQGAVQRLDTLTSDEEQKCQMVSQCAHVFPQERIDYLREIYEHGGVDRVLVEMYRDPFWYERPVRRGNVLYMRKNPFDPEGYQKAATPAERRKAYCHCPLVHPYLDEIPAQLSPTFCYCGAGWYRRLWEGILSQPVKIEHVETLLRGSQQCTLTINLPLELSGECLPEP